MAGKALLLSAALLIAGCAAAVDKLSDDPTGYVGDIGGRVAAVDWSAARTVTLSLTEYAYFPGSLKFMADKPYRLVLRNEGKSTHYFVSAGFFKAIAARRLETPAGVVAAPRLESIVIEPGTTKTLEFVAIKPGRYELECTAPLHSVFGMVSTIEVT